MTGAGAWAGALLLLAAPDVATDQPPVPAAFAQQRFAPPLGQPMTYRVTTRRISRNGTLIAFSLVYALQWQQAGRGYRLDATLRRIESDARPELVRSLTGLLQPLVGEPISYMVGDDGRNIALADPAQLWMRVGERTRGLAATASAREAQQVAQLLATLPEAERDRLIMADMRALLAVQAGLPVGGEGGNASVSIGHDGTQRTIARVEKGAHVDGEKGTPLIDVDMLWTVDTATGLVMREQRQSWVADGEAGGRTLVEERIRALTPGDPG